MIVIQNGIHDALVDTVSLTAAMDRTLATLSQADGEVLLRLVDVDEIQQLNRDYRGKDQPTNVLSFPSDLPVEIEEAILGDVVICLEVVRKEALEQDKSFENHLLHMAVHGTLHLLGYDHMEEDEAETMESLEIKLLADLGVDNPYAD